MALHGFQFVKNPIEVSAPDIYGRYVSVVQRDHADHVCSAPLLRRRANALLLELHAMASRYGARKPRNQRSTAH